MASANATEKAADYGVVEGSQTMRTCQRLHQPKFRSRFEICVQRQSKYCRKVNTNLKGEKVKGSNLWK